MTGQQRWKQVRDLFDAVLDQPDHERDRYLAAHSAGDPKLAEEVRELLASYQQSDHLLTQPAIKGLEALLPLQSPAAPEPAPANAVMDPGEAPTMIERSVIRPATTTTSTPKAGRRVGPYRLVKQIGSATTFAAMREGVAPEQRVVVKVLRSAAPRPANAGLVHPNIARLLEAGVSSDGLPYVAMEYVEGEPIDKYCEERHLDVAKRLELFGAACAAVQYAHSRSVTHGGLDPGKILVTADGVPKVLGFGAASSLAPAATDVHALGAMLGPLLGGKAGDLAAIASPIPSKETTGGRRLHASVAIAAGLALLVLGGAMFASLRYANRARREMQAAEARLHDVHQLSRFVLFDFDDALRQGEAAARKALVPKALDYLQARASEAGGNPESQREAAEAYLKIGGMQEEDDTRGAQRSYEQALRMAEALAARDASSERDGVLAAQANAAIANLKVIGGGSAEAIPRYQRALSLLEPLANANPVGPPAQLQLDVSQRLGTVGYQLDDPPRALVNYTRAYEIGARLFKASPTNSRAQRSMAAALQGMGETYARMGRVNEALAKLTEANAILQRLLDENPAQPQARHDVAAVQSVLGDAFTAAGRHVEAAGAFRRALALTDELTRSDTANPQHRRDVPLAMARLAGALLRAGARAEAHDISKRALEALWPLVDARDPQAAELEQYVALLVATPFEDLRSPGRALPYAQQLVDLTKSSRPAALDLLARAYFGMGDAAKAVETARKAIALLPPKRPGEPPSALRKELEDNLQQFSQPRR